MIRQRRGEVERWDFGGEPFARLAGHPGVREVLHFNNAEEEIFRFCETLERIL